MAAPEATAAVLPPARALRGGHTHEWLLLALVVAETAYFAYAGSNFFTTGNAGKVQPVSRYEGRDLQPGPIGRQAHELYMAYSRTQRII